MIKMSIKFNCSINFDQKLAHYIDIQLNQHIFDLFQLSWTNLDSFQSISPQQFRFQRQIWIGFFD